jgi:hypothetical protein
MKAKKKISWDIELDGKLKLSGETSGDWELYGEDSHGSANSFQLSNKQIKELYKALKEVFGKEESPPIPVVPVQQIVQPNIPQQPDAGQIEAMRAARKYTQHDPDVPPSERI